MGRLAQFRLLLWKNYLLQRRKVLVTCFEIGLPTFYALILIFVRLRVQLVEVANSTYWRDFAINETFGGYNVSFLYSLSVYLLTVLLLVNNILLCRCCCCAIAMKNTHHFLSTDPVHHHH